MITIGNNPHPHAMAVHLDNFTCRCAAAAWAVKWIECTVQLSFSLICSLIIHHNMLITLSCCLLLMQYELDLCTLLDRWVPVHVAVDVYFNFSRISHNDKCQKYTATGPRPKPSLCFQVVRLSVCPIFWTWYLRYSWREFLQMWHRHSLML